MGSLVCLTGTLPWWAPYVQLTAGFILGVGIVAATMALADPPETPADDNGTPSHHRWRTVSRRRVRNDETAHKAQN